MPGVRNRTFLDIPAAVRRVYTYGTRNPGDQLPREDRWLSRVSGGSGLGGDTAREALSEFVEGFAGTLLAGYPGSLKAPPGQGAWQTCSIHETIEAHAAFFADGPGRRLDGAKRIPYDEMAVAFPAVARLLAPLLLGQALREPGVSLDALEVVILHRKRTATKMDHAHTGKRSCGCTLNVLTLVAHVHVQGERRCLVLGSQPLSAKADLLRSIPLAVGSLLGDLYTASKLLRDQATLLVLLAAPVVIGTLYAGGPLNKSPRGATDKEIVPGLTSSVMRGVYEPRRGPVRAHMALAIPTRAGEGPLRIAPASLVASDERWPASTEPFVLAFAAAGADDAAVTALSEPSTGEWWSTSARLRESTSDDPVQVIARRPEGTRATTVWVALGDSNELVAGSIDAVMRSRMYAGAPNTSASLAGTPFDLWIGRAYRRRAAGGLLLKGGASEGLRVGVTAAMNAAFTAFVLTAPALKS
jgi:hypothetical protein